MMISLSKLNYGTDELKSLEVSPNRSRKERAKVRLLVQRAKNLTAEEVRKLHTYRQKKQNSESKEKKCHRSLKQGNREQFQRWFCNVNTLTTRN